MRNETDQVEIEQVPVFKASEQDIEQFLKDLFGYCVRLHNHIKGYDSLGFPNELAVELFTYLVKNSNEPQYNLMRTITLARGSIEDGGAESDASTKIVAEVFSEIERLKFYVNKLKAMTYEDLSIRAIAEFHYMDGLTVNEITDELIALEILHEYSRDEKKDSLLYSHRKQISKYVSSFKDYDAQTDLLIHNDEV